MLGVLQVVARLPHPLRVSYLLLLLESLVGVLRVVWVVAQQALCDQLLLLLLLVLVLLLVAAWVVGEVAAPQVLVRSLLVTAAAVDGRTTVAVKVVWEVV